MTTIVVVGLLVVSAGAMSLSFRRDRPTRILGVTAVSFLWFGLLPFVLPEGPAEMLDAVLFGFYEQVAWFSRLFAVLVFIALFVRLRFATLRRTGPRRDP